jgi:tetratricopeptide (TPR) repeat protein
MTIKESKPLDRMFFDRPSDFEKQAALFLKQGLEAEKKRDFEAAVIAYKQAMALNPTHKEIWYFIHNNLGYSLNQIGEFEEGEKYCRVAIQINPNLSNAHKNLGLALVGQDKNADAAKSYVRAIEATPGDTRSLVLLLKLLQAHPELKSEFQADADRCEQLSKKACGVDPMAIFVPQKDDGR